MATMISAGSGNARPGRSRVAATNQIPSPWVVGLAGAALFLAGWAVYSNSFGGPFTFDDKASILRNPTIQQGWWAALHPPAGSSSVSGRPLLNLSLALNYQLDGFYVRGYHIFNLAIQLLAGLAFFGLVRRSLAGPVLHDRYGAVALPLAFVMALLWTVHPLQTEAVTYVIQRAESMMGLFYLLTLYFFVRGAESKRAWVWYVLSATACLLGMVTKETMATAPLIVLLYDRTFIAGTFAAAWRQRWKFYAVLAGTWLPLAWLVATVSWPGNASLKNPALAGLSLGMKSYVYGLKQCQAIVHYLWLSFWPHPLVFNYGADVVTNPLDVAPQIALLALLLGVTIYALWRKPALGFLGAWFFVILAPTSSVVPLAGQTMAEHHLYLSLAAIMVFMVLGLYALLGRCAYVAVLALAVALGSLTMKRNHDYRTGLSVWLNLLQERPDDASAHNNFAEILQHSGRMPEAAAQYATSLRIDPDDSAAENNLGTVLGALGHPEEALGHLQRSLKLDPTLADTYSNLGRTYAMLNEPDKARAACLAALRLDPNSASAHSNLGNIYILNYGAVEPAVAEYKAAIRADPHFPQVQVNLGNLYLKTNRAAEAIPCYTAAINNQRDFADAYEGLGLALFLTGRAAEALPPFTTALRLSPDNAGIHYDFGCALLQLKRYGDAVREFEETLRLSPNFSNARDNLEKARQLAGPPNGAAQT